MKRREFVKDIDQCLYPKGETGSVKELWKTGWRLYIRWKWSCKARGTSERVVRTSA